MGNIVGLPEPKRYRPNSGVKIRALLIDAEKCSITEIEIPIENIDEVDRPRIAAILQCEEYILHQYLDEDEWDDVDDLPTDGDVLQAENGHVIGSDPRHWFILDGGSPIPSYGLVSGYGPDFEDVSAVISLEELRERVWFSTGRRICTPVEGGEPGTGYVEVILDDEPSWRRPIGLS